MTRVRSGTRWRLGAALVAVLVYFLGFDRAQQLADVANKLALTVAAIVGGYWVCDRFVRERVGESRLDLTVSGEALYPEADPGTDSGMGVLYLAVTVGAENVGTEKADLDHDYCALTFATHNEVGPARSRAPERDQEAQPAGEAEWLPLDRVFFVLQEQDAIEPGASFGDQLLIRMPSRAPASGGAAEATPVAVRLDLVVQSRDGGYWAATSIVTPRTV